MVAGWKKTMNSNDRSPVQQGRGFGPPGYKGMALPSGGAVSLVNLLSHVADESPGDITLATLRLLACAPSVFGQRQGVLETKSAMNAGTYRQQLRANGQQALQSAKEAEADAKMPPPAPTIIAPTVADLVSTKATPPAPPPTCADDNLAPDKEERLAFGFMASPMPVGMVLATGPSCSWTEPASPQARHMVMVPMSPLMAKAGSVALEPADRLMAILMPQVGTGKMNCDEIAAQLRAVAPVHYEE